MKEEGPGRQQSIEKQGRPSREMSTQKADIECLIGI